MERQVKESQTEAQSPPVKLTCYALHDFAPKLVAARPDRKWMDDFTDRHAYRCLPLSIANAHGWHVLCPVPIEVEWNGGPAVTDLKVRALKPLPGNRPIEHFCRSNFSRGIVTMHVDYLFRTDPGWDLLATGPANSPKDNAYPLTGIIESDWLPYPFTMNWQILRAGRAQFEEDEPICAIFPIRKNALAACEPEIRRLTDDPELFRQHEEFRAARDKFMARFNAGDPAAYKEAWQKHYFVGRYPDGTRVDQHINKLRLKEPVDRRGPRPLVRRSPYRISITQKLPAAPNPAVQPAAAGAVGRSDPRWHDNSILNRIEKSQSQRNVAGRQRIDQAGHLRDKTRTRIIRSQADAADCDFVVLDLLSEEQCELLSRAFWELENRVFKSDAIDPYWNDRFLWYADIARERPAAARLMLEAQRRALQYVSEFYGLKAPIYPDLLQIVRWNTGMSMRPHADNANPDGSEHGMAHREFAGVCYLNDDYDGGELYFTALDIVVKPRRGVFVAMTAGFHHEHAVLRVDSGTRLTMPTFMTFDAAKADRSLC
jgi:hypothetical protein